MPLLYALVFLVPTLVGTAATPLYVLTIHKGKAQVALVLLVALLAWGILLIPVIAYTTLSGFGPGTLLSFLLIPLALLSFLSLLVVLPFLFRTLRLERWRLWLYLLGIVLIPLLLFGPVLGATAYGESFDAWNRRTAETIVPALESYRRDHGDYPAALPDLVPAYLPAVPTPRGFSPYRWLGMDMETEFALLRCRENPTPLLTVPVLRLGWTQRYNLATGNWSTVDFLDGECSFLR